MRQRVARLTQPVATGGREAEGAGRTPLTKLLASYMLLHATRLVSFAPPGSCRPRAGGGGAAVGANSGSGGWRVGPTGLGRSV